MQRWASITLRSNSFLCILQEQSILSNIFISGFTLYFMKHVESLPLGGKLALVPH